MTGINVRLLILNLNIIVIIGFMACNRDQSAMKRGTDSSVTADSTIVQEIPEDYRPVNAMLVLPGNPVPGEKFRILTTGGKNILKAQIIVTGAEGDLKSTKRKTGDEFPYWRIDDYPGTSAGTYNVTAVDGEMVLSNLEFTVSSRGKTPQSGTVWKTANGWDSGTEAIYSAWINALFHDCEENASWSALHEVTQNPDQNFLYNYLSLGEDDSAREIRVIMQPDCADNPFFLRAYFAWKLGLPFGYHVCDRGSLGHNP